MSEYIMSLDEGTGSVRALLVNKEGEIVSLAQKEYPQYYPHPGWVEQDPMEIWSATQEVIQQCMAKSGVANEEVKAIGITNQRETAVVWDKNTGVPIYNDIVWSDGRMSPYCDEMIAAGHNPMVKAKTGLMINTFFSATKIKWMLDNIEGAREAAEKGDLIFSNIDGWILWNLTKGEAHMTDYGNASRTLLFNINTLDWDDELLDLFTIPRSMCPEVKESCGHFASTKVSNLFGGLSIPIEGILGDQMSATFGQACFKKGQAKMTWGTAGVMMMNVGDKPVDCQHGSLCTIGWGIKGKVQYMLEGTVYNAGSAIQWLRDEMDLIDSAPDSEYFAKKSALPLGTVYMVPSFSGLGGPWYDTYARGTIFGMSRGANKYDIIRATLDSLAYQTRDQLETITADAGLNVQLLRIDGGACNNNLATQFAADILGINVERPSNVETTAMGAAYIAGLSIGFWESEADVLKARSIDKVFSPEMDADRRERLYAGWKNCAKAIMVWSEGEKVL